MHKSKTKCCFSENKKVPETYKDHFYTHCLSVHHKHRPENSSITTGDFIQTLQK